MALPTLHAARRLVFVQQVTMQCRIRIESSMAKQASARACWVHGGIMIRQTSNAPKRSSTGKTPILRIFRVLVANMIAQSNLRCTYLPTFRTKRFGFTTGCFMVI